MDGWTDRSRWLVVSVDLLVSSGFTTRAEDGGEKRQEKGVKKGR